VKRRYIWFHFKMLWNCPESGLLSSSVST